MPGEVVRYTKYTSMKTTMIRKPSTDSALCTEARVIWPVRSMESVSETKWNTMPRYAACKAILFNKSLVRVRATSA